MKFKKRGFSLVEVMVVAAIIGVISAIAFPNFLSAQRNAGKNACLANIKQIYGALEVAALEEGISVADLSEDEIGALIAPDYIKNMPDCSSGDYSTDATGSVHCSTHEP